MRNALDCQNVNSILQICLAKWRLNKHEKFLAGKPWPRVRWSRSLPAELRFADSRFSWAKSVQLAPPARLEPGLPIHIECPAAQDSPTHSWSGWAQTPHLLLPCGQSQRRLCPRSGRSVSSPLRALPFPALDPSGSGTGCWTGRGVPRRARGCPQAQRSRRGAGRPLSLAGTLAGARSGRRVAKGCGLSQPGAGSCPFKNQLAQGVLTCSA